MFTLNADKQGANVDEMTFLILLILNDNASIGERTRTVTATAPSHAISTTLPTQLAGTTPKEVDRVKDF
jgi:hypothetical protein